MSRAGKRHLPAEPVALTIRDLSHDGRGVARLDERAVFVHGALPGERVTARLTARRRGHDEAETCEMLEPSPHRVTPRCPHFEVCGGCSLQHLDGGQQLEAKQEILVQNLMRIGHVQPAEVFEPLRGNGWYYRRKARLSVRYVYKKHRALVGFRERRGRYVADMSECHVLQRAVAERLPDLSALVGSLDARESIPQIEVACGDDRNALVFRHLEPLSPGDLEKLRAFARSSGIAVFLQPGGPDSVAAFEPEHIELSYSLPAHDVTLWFGPADFVQVNGEMNRRMVDRALELLEPEPQARVLDLFCGLGNFTLPIARRAAEVFGVEGDPELVQKAADNAARNGLDNVRIFKADLTQPLPAGGGQNRPPWLRQACSRVLLDPPRSGAREVIPAIGASGASRVVYVSCNPASLARDAGALVHQHGFSLSGAGVMDMFPHTTHVESIALFERSGQ